MECEITVGQGYVVNGTLEQRNLFLADELVKIFDSLMPRFGWQYS